MPHLPLYIEAKDVGQGKPLQDFTQYYDREMGTYKVRPPAVKPGKPTPPPAPFKLR